MSSLLPWSWKDAGWHGWKARQHITTLMQEEGLRAVAHKRRRRLARQAAIQWRKVVAKAREDAEQERRTLEALANVHVGIRATPFRIHWPSHASQEQRVSHLTLSQLRQEIAEMHAVLLLFCLTLPC